MNTSLLSLFAALLQGTTLKYILLIPLVLIICDLVTGVVSALRNGVFAPKYLSNFLAASGDGGKFLTTLIATFSAFLFSGSNVTVTITATATMVAMAFSLIASIAENLSEIFPGQSQVINTLAQDAEQVLGLSQEQQQLQHHSQPAQLPAPAPPTPSISFVPAQQSQVAPRLDMPAQMAPYRPVAPLPQQPTVPAFAAPPTLQEAPTLSGPVVGVGVSASMPMSMPVGTPVSPFPSGF